MRIVVTGSTGLIGTLVCEALRNRGDEVIRFVRSSPELPDERYWRPSQQELDPVHLTGVDAIVHLAGAAIADQRWSKERKTTLWNSRVLSTRLLVDAIESLDEPPQVFISASGINIYGDCGEAVVDESHSPGDGFLPELCEAWEHETTRAKTVASDIRVVSMRTGVVLSTEGGALAEMLLPFKMGIGGRLGDGRQYMSWISLVDIVHAYLFAIDNTSIDGPVNATSPTPITNRVFTRALGEALHRPAAIPVPALAIKMLWGEMGATLLLEGVRAKPEALVESGFRFRYTDIHTCLNDLF